MHTSRAVKLRAQAGRLLVPSNECGAYLGLHVIGHEAWHNNCIAQSMALRNELNLFNQNLLN